MLKNKLKEWEATKISLKSGIRTIPSQVPCWHQAALTAPIQVWECDPHASCLSPTCSGSGFLGENMHLAQHTWRASPRRLHRVGEREGWASLASMVGAVVAVSLLTKTIPMETLQKGRLGCRQEDGRKLKSVELKRLPQVYLMPPNLARGTGTLQPILLGFFLNGASSSLRPSPTLATFLSKRGHLNEKLSSVRSPVTWR